MDDRKHSGGLVYTLRAYLTCKQYTLTELIETRLAHHHTKKNGDSWWYDSGVLTTPLGLPVRLIINRGPKENVEVYTADARLLLYGMPATYFELWLPTDETLHVELDERRD